MLAVETLRIVVLESVLETIAAAMILMTYAAAHRSARQLTSIVVSSNLAIAL